MTLTSHAGEWYRMVAAQAISVKGWYKSSNDQTTSLFFIEKFTFAVWKVALNPTDMDQKYLTDSESLSLNIETTCLLLSSPRNVQYAGPLVEPLKPLETFNLVAIL